MSKSKCFRAVGLMTGTSMDGVDTAILEARVDENGEPSLSRLGDHHETAFDANTRNKIQAVLGREIADQDTCKVEELLASHYADAVRALLNKARLQPQDIDVIGLHGQTITHRPERHFTWQLGDGQSLADATGIDVVYDFRKRDILNGGQGAPLAPVFHQALARTGRIAELPLSILNVGGVGNITLLDDGLIRAYDTGPGNGSMDDYCQEHLQKRFDTEGAIARAGVVDHAIVEEFLQHPYFAQPAPKSLDRRDFSHQPVQHLSAPDALRTLAACSAAAIAQALRTERTYAPNMQTVLITGGGRHNVTLLEELALRVPDMHIQRLDDAYPDIHGDALEAWAFAWLAILHLCQQPVSFPTTTGVKEPQTAGIKALARPQYAP